MLVHLIKNKLRILFNHFRKGDRRSRLRILIVIAAWGTFIRFLYPGLYAIFTSIISTPELGEIVAVKVLAIALFGLFVALLLSGVTICIHTLFISQDIPLLLSSPISRRSLFIFKVVESTFSNSSIFLMLGIPILIAFGAAMHAGIPYYVLMLLIAAIFLFIPTSFAAMVSLLVVWIVPVKRAREVMSTILALVFVAIWAGMQLMRSSFFGDPGSVDPQELAQLSAVAHHPLFLYFPSGWMAKSLMALAEGDWRSLLMGVFILAVFTGGMLLVSIALVENVYYRGVAGGEAIWTARTRRKKTISPTVSVEKEGPRSQVALLLIKDFRLLRRDLPQFMQFFMFAVMMVVMAIVFHRDMDGSTLSLAESLISYLFIWFFSAMSTAALATRLIPLEGKAFYLAKISPQPESRIVTAKLMLSWIMGFAVAMVGVIVVTILFSHSLFHLLVALLVALAICLGISGIGVAIGAACAKYDWDNPKRMVTTVGGLLAGILPSFYLLITGALGVAMIYLSEFVGFSDHLGIFAAVILVSIVSVVTALLSLQLASHRIERLSWQY